MHISDVTNSQGLFCQSKPDVKYKQHLLLLQTINSLQAVSQNRKRVKILDRLLILQIFFATRAVLKIWEYSGKWLSWRP